MDDDVAQSRPADPGPQQSGTLAVRRELERLAREYPAFRFTTLDGRGHREPRWVAERIRGLDPGLHTVITADLGELRASLDYYRLASRLARNAALRALL